MRAFKEIRSHYDFSIEDERLLASIRKLMDDRKKEYVFDSHKNWFHCLFAGNYP